MLLSCGWQQVLADSGVDNGDDKMVTILKPLATWVYLSGSRNRTAMQPRVRIRHLHRPVLWLRDTPRNLIARTNCEFERHANVEIREFFSDDKTEMAGVETEPNEESMEYAQASDSIPCGSMKEPRYRQCRMRAFEEECDMCSSLHVV